MSSVRLFPFSSSLNVTRHSSNYSARIPWLSSWRGEAAPLKSPRNHPQRPTSNSATAYPSGSVKNPTEVLPVSKNGLSHFPPRVNPPRSTLIPLSHRKMPRLPNRKPFYVLTFIAISGIWFTFVEFSTNAEKANSSVVNAVLFELRTSPISQAALGYPIRPDKDNFFGQLWVEGQINLMQGAVDVAFRVTGSSSSGKVYFTSVRRDREAQFEIIRWKLIRDDGVSFDLSQQPAPHFSAGDGVPILMQPFKAPEEVPTESGAREVVEVSQSSPSAERLL